MTAWQLHYDLLHANGLTFLNDSQDDLLRLFHLQLPQRVQLVLARLSIQTSLLLMRFLDPLDLARQDAIDSVNWITLSVQILVSEGFVGLLSLLIVEEAIDILQSPLRHIFEQVEHDNLVQLHVNVLLLPLEEHPVVVVLQEHSCYHFIRHAIAGRIARSICDQGVLTEALPLHELIHVLHHLQLRVYLVLSRLWLANTAIEIVCDAVKLFDELLA